MSVTAKDLVSYAQGKDSNITDITSNRQVKLQKGLICLVLIVLQIRQRDLYSPTEWLNASSHTSLACASAIFRLFSSSIRSSSSRFARSSS